MADLSFLSNTATARKELRLEAKGNIEQIIGEWVTERIEDARQNLTESGNNSTGQLANSIIPIPIEDEGKLIVKVMAEEYYDYINSGVNGVQTAFDRPYSFKTLGVGDNMRIAFENFIRNKNIFPRDDSMSYEQLAYVLARAVKRDGIAPNHFMDKAFSEKNVAELTERIGKEVIQIFN